MITLGATDYSDVATPVLVHEMAHQWYGDEVTPDDWRDVWMNEGMAMYLQGMLAGRGGRPDRRRAVMDEYAPRRGRAARGGRPARRRTTRRSSARATSTTARR